MSTTPANLRYTKSHEWVLDNGDETVTIGITSHAQELLGDVVFVELPELERTVEAGEEFALVESVKAASDIYSPLSGVVIAVNDTLSDAPETVNSDPYGDGWMVKLHLNDAGDLNNLLDAAAYSAMIADA
ncbi:glycine cleavage system protein GcvH [Nitrincola alkalilacustris]|uniref:glycine cleavage system protein GcvH n=1 Tax=Nitrincola alkalilacustris TaxID=1571224 RepID=UPI00124F63C8|nr:glycine cleavage system protein GcvH [Nitrincola alkalilacustris]